VTAIVTATENATAAVTAVVTATENATAAVAMTKDATVTGCDSDCDCY
jgi:hypothetical protein